MRSLLSILIGLLLLSCGGSKSLPQAEELRKYAFAELEALMQSEARPVVVFLHTDWCRYCANMKQTTFRNSEVVRELNQRYYFISFDGESRDPVDFRGHSFRFQPKGSSGTHELALALGTQDGQLAYPSLVILDEQYQIAFQHQAFLSGKDLLKVLQAE